MARIAEYLGDWAVTPEGLEKGNNRMAWRPPTAIIRVFADGEMYCRYQCLDDTGCVLRDDLSCSLHKLEERVRNGWWVRPWPACLRVPEGL